MKEFSTFFYILTVTSFISACSTVNEVSTYQQEAKKLCDVFKHRSWESAGKNLEAWELQNAINKSIYSVIKSKEMTDILQSLSNVAPERRYASYIEQTSKLTKQKQNCPNLKKYFGY